MTNFTKCLYTTSAFVNYRQMQINILGQNILVAIRSVQMLIYNDIAWSIMLYVGYYFIFFFCYDHHNVTNI